MGCSAKICILFPQIGLSQKHITLNFSRNLNHLWAAGTALLSPSLSTCPLAQQMLLLAISDCFLQGCFVLIHPSLHPSDLQQKLLRETYCCYLQDARISKVLEFLQAPSQLSDKDYAAKVCFEPVFCSFLYMCFSACCSLLMILSLFSCVEIATLACKCLCFHNKA